MNGQQRAHGRTNRANHEPIFDDRPGTGTAASEAPMAPTHHLADDRRKPPVRAGRRKGIRRRRRQRQADLHAGSVRGHGPCEASKFTSTRRAGRYGRRRERPIATRNRHFRDLRRSYHPDPQVGSDRCYTVKVEVRDGLNADRVEVEDEDCRRHHHGEDRSARQERGPRGANGDGDVARRQYNAGSVLVRQQHGARYRSGYDVQYRKGSGTFLDDNCGGHHAGEGNCNDITKQHHHHHITGLDEETLPTRCRCGRRMREGTSAWSRLGNGEDQQGHKRSARIRLTQH